jgi:hypothetical protein
MKNRRHEPKPALFAASLVRMLPVVAAQAFALWAALSDSLDYFDYQVLVVVELVLVQLSLALIAKPRARGERWRILATTTFVAGPAMLFFLALLVPIALETTDDPATPMAIVDGTVGHLTGDGLRWALGYLALGFGIAIVQARFDANPRAWWERHVVEQNMIEMVALIAGMFLLAPVIIARQQIAWVGAREPATIGVVLIVMMIALRLALTLALSERMRDDEAAAEPAAVAPRRRRGARRIRGAAR